MNAVEPAERGERVMPVRGAPGILLILLFEVKNVRRLALGGTPQGTQLEHSADLAKRCRNDNTSGGDGT